MPEIKEAVGIAVPIRLPRAALMEAAMLSALRKAQAKGEGRPHVLKKRMLEARMEMKRRMGDA